MRIMAPAGNIDAMRAAIRAGADEVYMGIAGFGARRFARNFSVGEYCDAVAEAHRFGTHVNVTLNTIMSDEEIVELGSRPDAETLSTLEQLYTAGVDAVIVQDLGFAEVLRQAFPDWPIHASTQLSIAAPEEAVWAEQQDFTRLVLARELSFEEIHSIRRALRPETELEVFASGALCIACSGKCFLSSFIGGRSGNRGMCTQPCRQEYRRLDGKKSADGRNRGFLLSSCDQFQEEDELRRFAEIGVDVIKLEGRMKSPEYVFTVVRYYRNALDRLFGQPGKNQPETEPMTRETVARIFNRGYAKGYVYEADPDFLNPAFSASWGVPLGTVDRKRFAVRLSDTVRYGDGIVFLDRFLQKIAGQNVSEIVPFKTGESVPQAEAGSLVRFDGSIPPNAVWVYKTYDFALNKQIESHLKNTRRRNPVTAILTAQIGKPLSLTLKAGDRAEVEVTVQSDEPLGAAMKQVSTAEKLASGLDRFGQTPFRLDMEALQIHVDDGVFVPTSVLNQVRQNAVAALEAKLEQGRPLKHAVEVKMPVETREPKETPVRFSAAVTTLEQARTCQEMGIERIYHLAPPVHFARNQWDAAEGLTFSRLACSLWDAVAFSAEAVPFALDWTFNIGNTHAIAFCQQAFHPELLFLSPELSAERVAFLRRHAPEVSLGLVVYGHLYGMYTRKTLFPENVVPLENQDGRPVLVTRNAANENHGETTGSRVYYGEAMDLTPRLEELQRSGLQELRFDFTGETAEDVRRLLARIQQPNLRPAAVFSYGYTKGIF